MKLLLLWLSFSSFLVADGRESSKVRGLRKEIIIFEEEQECNSDFLGSQCPKGGPVSIIESELEEGGSMSMGEECYVVGEPLDMSWSYGNSGDADWIGVYAVSIFGTSMEYFLLLSWC
jgi:hypothetical protein